MSDRSPYEQLGITEDAAFEEIQAARSRLVQEHSGDKKSMEMIEAAYDAILMERLKMRQEGKIRVPERIRFPEKLTPPPPNLVTTTINQSPAWLQRLLDQPSRNDLLWTSGVLLISGAVAAYPGVREQQLSLAMAFGVGFCLFFLNKKENQFFRALLLTVIGLFVGIGLGALLFSWMTVPLTGMGLTSQQFASLVTFIILWAIASFLR
jgi:hypothetical protein